MSSGEICPGSLDRTTPEYRTYGASLKCIGKKSRSRGYKSAIDSQLPRAKYSDDTVELHKRYGKIVRIGPDVVSVVRHLKSPSESTLTIMQADPHMIDRIFGHRQDFDKVSRTIGLPDVVANCYAIE